MTGISNGEHGQGKQLHGAATSAARRLFDRYEPLLLGSDRMVCTSASRHPSMVPFPNAVSRAGVVAAMFAPSSTASAAATGNVPPDARTNTRPIATALELNALASKRQPRPTPVALPQVPVALPQLPGEQQADAARER